MTDQLTPDAAQIRLHLEILFSDLDALGPEDLFELRFLPPNDGKSTCKLFTWGDIDKAVEMAERANANGMNGYVGVHPRKPGTSRAGQASDVDRAYCQFVDCDDGEASTKLLKLPFSPNFIVTTGTQPTQRLHGYYMLEAPETDMAAYTARQAALAAAVGGDNVKDAPRIMRLAGTVSYPSKDKATRGYVRELVTISDADPIPYAAEELDPFLAQFKTTAEPQLLAAPSTAAPLDDAPPTVRSLLERSRTQGHWHNSMLRATAALLARGFGEDRVAEICGPFCNGGASDPELQMFIVSAVSKGFMGQPARSPQDIVLTTPRERGNLLGAKNIITAGQARYVTKQHYLIKQWLPFEGTGVLVGPSNTGKTFIALDMAMSIAAGTDWHGHKVRQGAALYLATEGSFSFKNRMAALKDDRGLTDNVPLIARADMVNLLDQEADLAELAALADEIIEQHGPLRLIVVDTLARAMAGGNENAPDDMGKLLNNVEALRQGTDAFVLLIHHTGKDETKGARGHSSLKGAADTILLLSKRDDDLLELKSDKQRDMAPPRPKAFRLETVVCGMDEDLDEVTTCVVQAADAAELKAKPKPGGPNQEMLMECYTQLRLEGIGEPNPGGAGFPEQSQYWCVPAERLKEMFAGKKDGSNKSSAYGAALNGLKSRNLLLMNGGLVWMPTEDGKCNSVERRGAAASS